MLRTVVSACMFAVLALSIDVHAQTADRRTFFTFSHPVTLPGVTLPPGTYQFRLASDTGPHHVVQILDREATHAYATLQTVPAMRPAAMPGPDVQFMETAGGFPPAIQAWWYDGRAIGYEFIYPREQALRLAGGAREPATIAARTLHAEMVPPDLAAGGAPAVLQ